MLINDAIIWYILHKKLDRYVGTVCPTLNVKCKHKLLST